FSVREANLLKNVPDDSLHVQCKHHTSPQLILVKERRLDFEVRRIDEILHKSDQLREKSFLVPFPRRFHLLVNIASNFEDDPLKPERISEFAQIDLRHHCKVGLACDHCCHFGVFNLVSRIQAENWDPAKIYFELGAVDVINSNE